MLFIGDTHITTKHAPAILELINQQVTAFPDEKTIIFLGDYVYHFTYDRKALLKLFSKFLELAQQGKDVYILAGNHDRVSDHFVYEEGKQAFALLGELISNIHFITQPVLTQIEGQDCLLFPYRYPAEPPATQELLPELQAATHPGQQLSRKVNNILHWYITERKKEAKQEKLLIIHHRYIANTQFPGQHSTFGYGNGALTPAFLEDSRLWFISGHLHEPFCYERYLCTGSLRHTTPLETDQQKYGFCLHTATRTVSAFPLTYNPYFTFSDQQAPITQEVLQHHYEAIHNQILSQLAAGQRKVSSHDLPALSLIQTTVTVQSPENSFDKLEEYIAPGLRTQLKDIRYKSIVRGSDILLEKLDTASLDLTQRFSDRKVLLRRFLEQKYADQAPAYVEILEGLKIL